MPNETKTSPRSAGNRAAAFIALGATACFGARNGWILIAGQLPLAVARRGAATMAMIIGSALATALIAANYSRSLVNFFTFIILLSTLSTLVPYAFCSLAGFILQPRRGEARRLPWPTGAAFIASLAFLYSLWALGGAGIDAVYWGFLLLAGLPVYIWVVRS